MSRSSDFVACRDSKSSGNTQPVLLTGFLSEGYYNLQDLYSSMILSAHRRGHNFSPAATLSTHIHGNRSPNPNTMCSRRLTLMGNQK